MKNSLPADRIEFAKGRTDKEIAVILFIGKVELSFVLPVEILFNKIADLTQRIKQVPDNQ